MIHCAVRFKTDDLRSMNSARHFPAIDIQINSIAEVFFRFGDIFCRWFALWIRAWGNNWSNFFYNFSQQLVLYDSVCHTIAAAEQPFRLI